MSFQFDHWEIYDPSTLQSPRKKKRVQYAEVCSVVLIPCRREYIEAGIDLWYHSEDINWNVRREFERERQDDESDLSPPPNSQLINGNTSKIAVDEKMDVCDSSDSSSQASDDMMTIPPQPSPDPSLFNFVSHQQQQPKALDHYLADALRSESGQMEVESFPSPSHSTPAESVN
jgi:hypothetical protein